MVAVGIAACSGGSGGGGKTSDASTTTGAADMGPANDGAIDAAADAAPPAARLGWRKLDVGASPALVAVGDLDGDKRLDVVAANNTAAGPSSVTILFGQPGGAFSAPITRAIGPKAITSLALRDVTRDGLRDVVAVDDVVTVPSRADKTMGDNIPAAPRTDGWRTVKVISLSTDPAAPYVELQMDPVSGARRIWVQYEDRREFTSVISFDAVNAYQRRDGDLVVVGNNAEGTGVYQGFRREVDNFKAGTAYGLAGRASGADETGVYTFEGKTARVYELGDGAFAAPSNNTSFMTAAQARALFTPDLDGDGRHDVLVVEADRQVEAFIGQPDHTYRWKAASSTDWDSPTGADATIAGAVGDLDGDKRDEVFIVVNVAGQPEVQIGQLQLELEPPPPPLADAGAADAPAVCPSPTGARGPGLVAATGPGETCGGFPGTCTAPQPLPTPSVSGTLGITGPGHAFGCTNVAGPEAVYALHTTDWTRLTMKWNTTTSFVYWAFSVRRSCADVGSELGCIVTSGTFDKALAPGDYSVIVARTDPNKLNPPKTPEPFKYDVTMAPLTTAPNDTCDKAVMLLASDAPTVRFMKGTTPMNTLCPAGNGETATSGVLYYKAVVGKARGIEAKMILSGTPERDGKDVTGQVVFMDSCGGPCLAPTTTYAPGYKIWQNPGTTARTIIIAASATGNEPIVTGTLSTTVVAP